MIKTIVISDVEPAMLSLRHPLGVALDLRVDVVEQNGAPHNVGNFFPQLVLMPRSRGGMRPYEMQIADTVNGQIRVQIPGYDLQDQHGYGLELYTRMENPVSGDPPIPTAMVARGAIITQGVGYALDGPLSIISVPTVTGPPGPTGAAGADSTVPGPPGRRGSVWTTGIGAPSASGLELPGDMYLDESNGDVWRFDGMVWARGTF
jgi:hypothetical protein